MVELKKQKGNVYIIVLNFNGKPLLRKCIESIQNKTFYRNYKIIVVDNNSQDKSVEMIKNSFPKVKLIENPKNYGFSKGNNIGIRKALKNEADFILLLNNDTEVRKNWLKEMVKVANSDEKIGIVGSKQILPNGKIQKSCYNYRYGLSKRFAPQKMEEVDCVVASCMLIKNEVVNKIGFLDENFFPIYFEDVDYCFRARKSGFKIIYTPESIIYHYKGITMKKQDWQFKTYHTNRLRFFSKHFLTSWLIMRFLVEPWNILKALKEGRLKTLFSIYSRHIRSNKRFI